MNKEEAEQFRLKFAKDNLEHKKNVYETYLKVLVKYNLSSTAYTSIKADEMYHNELMRLMKKARKNNKSLTKLMFGDPNEKKLTEIEQIKESEKYYDKLIKLIENRISMLPDDIKMKIAKDSVEKRDAWFGLFKFDDELNKKKKKSSKRTIRKKKSITVKRGRTSSSKIKRK